MLNVNALQKTLSAMSLPEIQKYASLHKNDPYVVAMAMSVANTKKQAVTAQQGMAGMQQMPKVVDQDIAAIAPQAPASAMSAAQLPEDTGIAQLPTDNIKGMAGGGIVAFSGGGTPFAQWLAERGITMQQYAQLPATEQQLMREVFRNPGPTMPAATTQAATVAAEAAPVAAEAATAGGRAYQAGRMLGKGLAKTGPALAGAEVLGNLGSYKFQEPGLDTSVGGVYDAFKAGNYRQAGRNLVMGLPEAGYDLVRSGAGLGDYLLPGQPLAEGVDKAVKYVHGNNITTPSDAAQADAAKQKALADQKAAADAAAKSKADFKVTSTEPTGNIMGSRRTPLQLAEAAAKDQAAAKERAGIANLMKVPAAPTVPAAQSGLGSIAEYAKEANAYAGDSPLAKQLERIDKQESAAAGEKKDAFNMALLKAGLGMMSGTSRHALENIGKGAMMGAEEYGTVMKDLKKAALERDKMRDAAEAAEYAFKRDDVKGYRDAKEKEANRAAELLRTQMTVDGHLKAAGITAGAQLEAAKIPTREERLYTALSDPNSAVAKGFKSYAETMGPEAKGESALLAKYAGPQGEMALKMLEAGSPQDKAMAASIRARLSMVMLPPVQTAPGAGGIRP